jgi:hypothetical protein
MLNILVWNTTLKAFVIEQFHNEHVKLPKIKYTPINLSVYA